MAPRISAAAPLNLLAMSYRYLARFMDAGLRYQRALAILEAHARGEGHEAADIYHNLGGLEHAAGNWLRGEPFARHAVTLRTKLLGSRHPAVAADLTALAALLDRQGSSPKPSGSTTVPSRSSSASTGPSITRWRSR